MANFIKHEEIPQRRSSESCFKLDDEKCSSKIAPAILAATAVNYLNCSLLDLWIRGLKTWFGLGMSGTT